MSYPLSHFTNLPELHLPSEILALESFGLSNATIDNSISVSLPNIILGKQAEFLFSETIKAATNFSILKENIQINHEKQTLGELDFIIENNTENTIYHVELACKFYLLKEEEHPQIEGQWIGPNLKDTLLDKLTKFRGHQFQLLRHPATEDILSSLKIHKIIQQRYCIKAKLFIPENYTKQLPTYYQNCIVGVWKKYQDLVLNKNARYAMPTKREWLLPEDQIKVWFSSNDISEVIKEQMANKRSPLVYEKLGDQILSFFVVWW